LNINAIIDPATRGSYLGLWDVAASKERVVLKGHQRAVLSVALTRDGSLLASGGMDRTVRVWDVADVVGESKGSRIPMCGLASVCPGEAEPPRAAAPKVGPCRPRWEALVRLWGGRAGSLTVFAPALTPGAPKHGRPCYAVRFVQGETLRSSPDFQELLP